MEIDGFFGNYEQLVLDGYLNKSTLGDLVLYNYTDRTTYDRYWTKETLESRGIVYNVKTKECVARPFPKFFNFNEHETTRIEALPEQGFIATEKLDGSLGILFRHEGNYRVTTRGSLHSEQGKIATEMLSQYRLSEVPERLTLCLEIIYPENRVVINYGDRRGLVLLAAFDRHSGEELPWQSLVDLSWMMRMSLPQVYDDSLSSLLAQRLSIPHSNEGWVLRFENGLRVKVKGEDYLRLAKIKATMGPLSIWEAMVVDKIEEYLEELPEELQREAESIFIKLVSLHASLVSEAQLIAKRHNIHLLSLRDKAAIKAMALTIQKEAPEHLRGYLFSIVRGKADKKILLKQIRPRGNVL